MHLCVCVCPLGYEKLFRITNQTNHTVFEVSNMALAINITDRHGFSNEVRL